MLLLFLLLALPLSSSRTKSLQFVLSYSFTHLSPLIHPHSFNVAHHLTSNYHSTSAVITAKNINNGHSSSCLTHSPSLKQNRRKIRALSPRWSIMCCFSLGLTHRGGSICGENIPPWGVRNLSPGCCAPTVKASEKTLTSTRIGGDCTHSAGLLWLMISHMNEFFSFSLGVLLRSVFFCLIMLLGCCCKFKEGICCERVVLSEEVLKFVFFLIDFCFDFFHNFMQHSYNLESNKFI